MTTANAARSEAGFFATEADASTGGATKGLRRAWGKYRAYRATLAELQGLTNRELSDIGMRRDTLKQIARRAVYGN